MRLIIVDDNIMFRTSIKEFLTCKYDCEVIAEASNGNDFLKLKEVADADVVLMDIEMDKTNGIEATKQISWMVPGIKVLAVTMLNEKVFLKQLIEAGFKGCVFKTDVFKILFPAIIEVMSGRLYYPSDMKV